MAHVHQEIPLLIGGTGPRAEDAAAAGRHRPAGQVPRLRARPRPRRALRQRAGGALRAGRRGLRAHHRRGHGLRHPGRVLHRQRRAHRADHPRRQRPRHRADADGARCRARRPGRRAGPGPPDGSGRPPPRPRPHLGLDGGHRPRLAMDRPAPTGAGDRPDRGRAGHQFTRGCARQGDATEGGGAVHLRDPQAAPRRPAAVLPPVRQPGPPPRRAGASAWWSTTTRPAPACSGPASGSTRSPGATSTTSSVGAPRSTRACRSPTSSPPPTSPAPPPTCPRSATALDGADARAPGRALPAARAGGGRGRRAVDLRRVQRRGRPEGRRPPPQRSRPAAPRRRDRDRGPGRYRRRRGHHLLDRGRAELAFLYHRPLDDFTVVPNGTDCAHDGPDPRGTSGPAQPLAGQVGPHPGPDRAPRATRGASSGAGTHRTSPRPGSSCGWPRSSPRCSS